MKTISILIVDDEPLARKRIARLLEEDPEMQIMGEARNGAEAIDLIKSKKPRLVFLDVEMPDMDGFAVINALGPANVPIIIFVTAYNQYALKAFDVHAIDYLLKPFDNERFREALDLAVQRIKIEKTQEFNKKMMNLMRMYQQDQGSFTTSFSMKKGGKQVSVSCEDIYWLEASGNYLALHTDEGEFLYRGTMNAVESELDPAHFLRIHRSCMINADRIERVHYLNNNEYKFLLQNGKKLISGRSFKDRLMAWLSESDF